MSEEGRTWRAELGTPPRILVAPTRCSISCLQTVSNADATALPGLQEGPQVRRAALLARVTARSSALAGLDDLDRKKREAPAGRERTWRGKALYLLSFWFGPFPEVALAAVTANGIALQWAPDPWPKYGNRVWQWIWGYCSVPVCFIRCMKLIRSQINRQRR